jgi:hypothetical protein
LNLPDLRITILINPEDEFDLLAFRAFDEMRVFEKPSSR